jgi:large subunit ribosomal protein L3
LIKIPELIVAQVKTKEIDWYEVVVLEFWEKKQKILREVSKGWKLTDVKKWDIVWVDILEWIKSVTVQGVSKWKWFAGAMKRYNFSGWPWRVWSKFHRALGSIGTRKPRRTKPGKKMHWHMGTDTITLKNIPIEIVNKSLNVIALKWPIPWARNSIIVLNF